MILDKNGVPKPNPGAAMDVDGIYTVAIVLDITQAWVAVLINGACDVQGSKKADVGR